MPSRRVTFPAVAALAIASILLGVLAALADGRDPKPARPAPLPRAPVVAQPLPAPPIVVAGKDMRSAPARGPLLVQASPCTTAKAPAAEPAPDDILQAFGVLRRAATPDDALPGEALKALRARGLEPFDPAAARLLRKQDDGARAWVVPVRDVQNTLLAQFRCVLRTVNPKFAHPRGAPPKSVTPTPAPPADKPHPGLAVVALDGAPAGAGGRLEDLVRGREPVAIDPCGGPNHDMLTVSGIVPDGVPAAFLTSPDGTAIRADVTSNAYTFVVPRAKSQEQRYVVWTGGDGTPHVQPLTTPPFLDRLSCATPERIRKLAPIVSPTGDSACAPYLPVPVPATLPRYACAFPLPPVRVAKKPLPIRPRHR